MLQLSFVQIITPLLTALGHLSVMSLFAMQPLSPVELHTERDQYLREKCTAFF